MSDVAPKSPRKARIEETQLVNVVFKYFKLAGVAVGVWLSGYLNFSPSWLLIGLILYVWKERQGQRKKLQIEIRQDIARDEQSAILARVEDLPSWVHFPEVERAEWFNKILDQIWPFIGDYVKELLTTNIQPKIQTSHAQMSSFVFTKIDLGDIPPRIGGVKVYTENVRRDEIYMDLDIIYSSDCELMMKIKGINLGVEDLQVRGTMRVIFKPLIGRMPLFGGISVFFLNNPTIDFNLKGLADALDFPGLRQCSQREMVEDIIAEQIANIMVLPNRIAVPMIEELNLNLLKYPPPEGVLRIHMMEARNLVSADLAFVGKGKSDPYAVLKFGPEKFKTKVINNTVNPAWNEVFETVIDCKDAQVIELEIRDEDPGSKDDKIGTASIDISSTAASGTVDCWLPLENVKKGDVHVKLVWMYLANDPMVLEQIDASSELSTCVLMVNLDSAKDLPRLKKQIAEPSPYAVVSIGPKTFETDEKPNTDSPVWEKPFRFLVHNPQIQKLDIQIFDKKNPKESLGDLTLPLKTLLSAPDMTLDQNFALKNSGMDSKINMRLCLRILTTENNPAWRSESSILNTNSSSVDPPAVQKEAKSTPDSASLTPQPQKEAAKTEQNPVVKKEEVKQVSAAKLEGQVIPPASNSGPQTITGTEVRQRKTKSSPAPAESDTKGAYGRGRIQLTFRYSSQRQKLVVVVHKCLNLLPCDSDNLADPYVKMYLLPDKSSGGKRKTQVVKNNLNPVFDETFEFPLKQEEIAGRDLDLTIRNDTSFFSSNTKVMGVVTIDLSKMDISKAATEWFDLHPEDSDDADKPVSVESDV
ncbi:extended synaptotagmin-2-like isoform X2 [Ostrea edulis]|uniref:extended synaptotagmin-2-like isoform X2 n=1 Tax=Ostrea edulis TaxID=37623 RepID=UPI0020954DD2|nr:extended synaptotagmin-2-like isoform X2 [Ostrea edulis]